MAEFTPGDPGDEGPGAAAPGPGPNGEPGGGAAAQEFHDFTEIEGTPSEHASVEVGLGDVTYAVSLKLSSYVFIPLLAMALVGGSMFFAYKMSQSPYAGWTLLGVAIFSMFVLGSAGWFAHKLLKMEKAYDPNKPPVVNLRRRTPHHTSSGALDQRKFEKRINARGKNKRPRSR
ncbi:hypothetical protein [Paractinoplanes rishiriensis]|uniref:Uncharacterized protein n=1 Tax=Paractinoplanes rishiriensis TaxID=1050105 RepID=A0A919JUX4_9ACTN|nr:hypothetical protein [Actinoplanes rishiriensis]GIE93872.1 hypothetical protein Ari01nite_13370 [Actinoplanes rishiriensis]